MFCSCLPGQVEGEKGVKEISERERGREREHADGETHLKSWGLGESWMCREEVGICVSSTVHLNSFIRPRVYERHPEVTYSVAGYLTAGAFGGGSKPRLHEHPSATLL